MRNQLVIALLFAAVSTPALSDVFDTAAATREMKSLSSPQDYKLQRAQTDLLEAQADLLKAQAAAVENERIRQEHLGSARQTQHQGDAQRIEQLRRQYQESQRALVAAQQREVKVADQHAGPDMYEKLRLLGQLRDDGILTEDEFNQQKKKVLDSH